MKKDNAYIVQFDGLRFFAIFMVMIAHWVQWQVNNAFVASFPFVHGVTLFFVLSGFLITDILLKNKATFEQLSLPKMQLIKSFYARRVLRIFPIYYITIFFLFIINFDKAREIFPWLISYSSNIYQSVNNVYVGYFNHFWSLAVEEQFYMIWPWMMVFIPMKHIEKTIVFVIAFSLASKVYIFTQIHQWMPNSYFTLSCMCILGLGALFAYWNIYRKPWIERILKVYWIVVSVIIYFACHYYFHFNNVNWGLEIVDDFLFAIMSVLIINYAAHNKFKSVFKFILENKFVIYAGKISYGMYVYHLFMMPLLWFILTKTGWNIENKIITFLALFFLTFFISHLSWKIIENPINNLKNKFPYIKGKTSVESSIQPTPIQEEVIKKNEFSPRFLRIEKYFFLLIVLLNLFPVFSGKFFPTLDGAAHLYNSNIINNLLFHHNQLTDFFTLNCEPIPNISGHVILAFFNLFLPAFLAEKILVLFILIALPYSFRYLIKKISSDNYFLSYLIIPFSFSYVFYLGFYNFCIGIVFLFFTLNFWIKNENKTYGFAKIAKLFLLLLITYFSHIFVFGILIFLLGLITFSQSLSHYLKHHNFKEEIIVFKKKVFVLLLSSLLPTIFAIWYFASRKGTPSLSYINTDELMGWLKNLRPIISLSFGKEEKYTFPIVVVIAILILTTIFYKIKFLEKIRKNPHQSKTIFLQIFKPNDIWLASALFMLVLYFVLPDSDGYAGFVSVRMGLIFFLLLMVWIALQKYPKWLIFITIGIVLYCNFGLKRFYYSASKELNNIAVDCVKASDLIKPNSIVLPLNYSDLWLTIHFSNYLGIDKSMVILENYECATGYFPVKWNENNIPNTIFGDIMSNQFPCVNWKSNEKNRTTPIDYIFILGDIESKKDSCINQLNKNIETNYNLIYNSIYCTLYQKN